MRAKSMSRIPINEIVGGSVLDIVRRAGGRINEVKLGNGTPLIEAAMVQDVFYVPSALATGQSVQIVGDRHMPLEAVFDDFTPRFVRQELLKRSLTELPDAEDTIDGTVCILGNVFSRNFCHWHEEMMKVIILERIGYECNYVIAELPAIREGTARPDWYSAGANLGGPATDSFSRRTLHHSCELSQRRRVPGGAACAAGETTCS